MLFIMEKSPNLKSKVLPHMYVNVPFETTSTSGVLTTCQVLTRAQWTGQGARDETSSFVKTCVLVQEDRDTQMNKYTNKITFLIGLSVKKEIR